MLPGQCPAQQTQTETRRRLRRRRRRKSRIFLTGAGLPQAACGLPASMLIRRRLRGAEWRERKERNGNPAARRRRRRRPKAGAAFKFASRAALKTQRSVSRPRWTRIGSQRSGSRRHGPHGPGDGAVRHGRRARGARCPRPWPAARLPSRDQDCTDSPGFVLRAGVPAPRCTSILCARSSEPPRPTDSDPVQLAGPGCAPPPPASAGLPLLRVGGQRPGGRQRRRRHLLDGFTVRWKLGPASLPAPLAGAGLRPVPGRCGGEGSDWGGLGLGNLNFRVCGGWTRTRGVGGRGGWAASCGACHGHGL